MKLSEITAKYFETIAGLRSKSPLTVIKEKSALKGWLAAYGEREVATLTRADLNNYAVARGESVSNRTINLDVLALHNVLKFARETGALSEPPVTETWVDLKHKTPRRNLIPDDTLEKFCTEATRKWIGGKRDGTPIYPHGGMLVDYLKLLAYSGCRRNSGLTLRWSDVDFKADTVVFHTKFDKDVVLALNSSLRSHLKDMYRRQPGENEFVFPSPTNPSKPWPNPSRLFDTVRSIAGLKQVSFHDFRHAFASRAVMLGLDFMTVASMLGHSDGGTLVSKVYGHLSNAHMKQAAATMKF